MLAMQHAYGVNLRPVGPNDALDDFEMVAPASSQVGGASPNQWSIENGETGK